MYQELLHFRLLIRLLRILFWGGIVIFLSACDGKNSKKTEGQSANALIEWIPVERDTSCYLIVKDSLFSKSSKLYRSFDKKILKELTSDSTAPRISIRLQLLKPSCIKARANAVLNEIMHCLSQSFFELPKDTCTSYESRVVEYLKLKIDLYQEQTQEYLFSLANADINLKQIEDLSKDLLIRDSIVYNKKNIVSLIQRKTEIEGGSQEKEYWSTYNFHLLSGERITLDTLFVPNYKPILDKIIISKIIQRYKISSKENLPSKGFLPYVDIHSNNNFYVTEHGIVFLFSPDEIAQKFVGPVRLEVSKDDLKEILNKSNMVTEIFDSSN